MVEWFTTTLEPLVVNSSELPDQELEEEEIGVDVGNILWGIAGVVLCCCVFKLCHWMCKRKFLFGFNYSKIQEKLKRKKTRSCSFNLL